MAQSYLYLPPPYSRIDPESYEILDSLILSIVRAMFDHIHYDAKLDYLKGNKTIFNVSP